jgi:hypothetical protein
MYLSRGVTRAPLASLLAFALACALGCVPTAKTSDVPSGAASLPCYGQQCLPNMQGAPVTSAPTVDCDAAQASLEFFTPFAVLDNEQYSSGNAEYWYQYVDGTAGIWPSGYSPSAIQQDICNRANSEFPPPGGNHVLHESGGLFTGWGGGIGVAIAHFVATDQAKCLNGGPVCPAKGGWSTSTQCYCPPPDSGPGALGYAIQQTSMDVSQWDGISFWARRGPNGQPLMRVLIGDKFTDDDTSYMEYGNDLSPGHTQPRLCERRGECSCLFQDTTCDWYSDSDPMYGAKVQSALINMPLPDKYLVPVGLGDGGYFCGPPGSHPGSASSGGTTQQATISNICGRSQCDNVYAAYPTGGPDPEWAGRACTPYTYRNGTQADVCYNPPGTVDASGNPVPADPLPAESDAQCGDHFTFPVHLSTTWQFYTIPFSQMFQQGWAKQAPYFDLSSVSVVRFTWDAGYTDYYVDNVRFYRLKGTSATTPPPYNPP